MAKEIFLVTENTEGGKKVINTTDEELIRDWYGKCDIVPERDARIFYLSINDETVTSYRIFGELIRALGGHSNKPDESDDRIQKIRKAAAQKKNERERMIADAEKEREELIEYIKSQLGSRIQYLLALANECMDNEMDIPLKFIARTMEGEYRIGFIQDKADIKYKWLGCITRYKGSQYIDGINTFHKGQTVYEAVNTQNEIIASDLKRFIKAYDLFEKEFLKWVDSLTE